MLCVSRLTFPSTSTSRCSLTDFLTFLVLCMLLFLLAEFTDASNVSRTRLAWVSTGLRHITSTITITNLKLTDFSQFMNFKRVNSAIIDTVCSCLCMFWALMSCHLYVSRVHVFWIQNTSHYEAHSLVAMSASCTYRYIFRTVPWQNLDRQNLDRQKLVLHDQYRTFTCPDFPFPLQINK